MDEIKHAVQGSYVSSFIGFLLALVAVFVIFMP